MIYLDSNIFIFAALDNGEKGYSCRKILKAIGDGLQKAATSTLTFDEVFWEVKRTRGFEEALRVTKSMLESANLTFLPVDTTVITEAHNIIKNYKLDPRDAIHAACLIINGIETMVSDDSDFDTVEGIIRKGIPRK